MRQRTLNNVRGIDERRMALVFTVGKGRQNVARAAKTCHVGMVHFGSCG